MSGETKNIDDGGPAFPLQLADDRVHAKGHGMGMSLRAYFAGVAMQGILTKTYGSAMEHAPSILIDLSFAPQIADTSVGFADALIAELAKAGAS